MARILYFMPELSLQSTAGNLTRVISLLRYFKHRGFDVDYFGIKDWGAPFDENTIPRMRNTGLVNNVYAGYWKPIWMNFLKRFFVFKLLETIKCWIYNIDQASLKNYGSFYLCNVFNKVLKENKYDYVIINYSVWAGLIRSKEYMKGARTIIDTHDFLTIHEYRKEKGKNIVGHIFKEEIKRLNWADEVWTLSTDEFYIFSQFLDTKVDLIQPNVLEIDSDIKIEKTKKYDLIYVASDNPHNKASIAWFFSEVYPLLPERISICMVGRIVEYIDNYPNVTKIGFIENLTELYSISRICICPMFSGTGVKLKVIEAMSSGLPIVCTSRATDGLPNKIDNGCFVNDTPKGFAYNIERLLAEENLYTRASDQSKRLYEAYFSTKVVYEKLDSIFKN